MKLKIFLMTVLLALQVMVASAANIPLMPLEDVKPGMRGIGKTVIVGDTIADFDVEVIGVVGDELANQSILVRLSGDTIEKTGGGAHGMSGSPVFIDDRLVGALAWGRGLDEYHYIFITPIGRMLKTMDTPNSMPVDWIPKSTPLAAAGFSELGLEYLKEELGAYGIKVTGGVKGNQESSKSLEPGSAIGISYLTGDFSLGGTGTVTWVDDDGNILAFGHSFRGRGACNFFMHKAWVVGFVPNLDSSNRISTLGSVIGTFNQDRSAAIAGVVGPEPKAIPITVQVRDLSRGLTNTYHMKAIEDEQLLPAIVNAATVSCMSLTADRVLNGTVRLKYEITGAGKDKQLLEFRHEDMYYATEKLEKVSTEAFNEVLKVLMRNKLEKMDVYGIKVDVEIADEVQVAEIVKVTTDAKQIHPGDTVPLKVVMRPFRGTEFTQTVNFEIPKKHTGGKLVLNVHGGSSVNWLINQLRKQKPEGEAEVKKDSKQKTLKDYAHEVNEADKNNSLIVDITAGMKNLNNGKGDLEALFKGTPYKKVIPYDFIIDGEAEVVIKVE